MKEPIDMMEVAAEFPLLAVSIYFQKSFFQEQQRKCLVTLN